MRGAEISALRGDLGADTVEFAHLCDVEPTTVSRWESGASEPSGPAKTLLSVFQWLLQDNSRRAMAIELFRTGARTGGLATVLFSAFNAYFDQRGNNK